MVKPGKLMVHDSIEGSAVPFLRGIMTRSLQDSGLDFDSAYAAATAIRRELTERGTITTDELRHKVIDYLNKEHTEHADHYRRCKFRNAIMVRDREGTEFPFSKNYLAMSLELTSLAFEEQYELASQVEHELSSDRERQWTSEDVYQLTVTGLRESHGQKNADRYAMGVRFARSGRPLVLLIGGATGCGKSTISSEVAHRLNVVRTQSTDMLREVMRLMISERLAPSLHTSSFNAWQSLHTSPERPRGSHELVEGYLAQSSQVGIGIEGVIQRARRERMSVIIEGVHLHPKLITSIAEVEDAVIIPCIVAVLKKKTLKARLIGRGQQATSRRSERYLKHFDSIWDLQSFLLDEADRFQVPIVTNHDQTQAIRDVMDVIAERLAKDKELSSPIAANRKTVKADGE